MPLIPYGETCQRRLSPETIELLRRNRKSKPSAAFTAAIDLACAELGIPTPDERKGGKKNGKRRSANTDQSTWNEVIAAIDEACPDWRGYTVEVANPALLELAA